jgi:hypothetical protein
MEPQLQSVSALEEPEKATQLAAKAFAASSDMPEMEELPDGGVTLPGGYLDLEGQLHTAAEVRELNGADEEMLSRPEVMKSMARFTQLLLQRGVTRIGPYENPDNKILGSLLIGDRDMLLLAIRRATYGDVLEMQVQCPACSETLDVKHDLAKDVPIKKMDNPMERSFAFTLNNGEEVKALLAVGSDQEAILVGNQSKSLAELNTLLLARCVSRSGGRPLGLDGARQMGIQDRRNLLTEITGRQPGPQYSKIDLDCGSCGKEFPMVVDLQDLFR